MHTTAASHRRPLTALCSRTPQFDVLYGTTRSSSYFWFAQILWLKTLINALFSFGRASEPGDALCASLSLCQCGVYSVVAFQLNASTLLLPPDNWHVWMHMILGISVCLVRAMLQTASPTDWAGEPMTVPGGVRAADQPEPLREQDRPAGHLKRGSSVTLCDPL